MWFILAYPYQCRHQAVAQALFSPSTVNLGRKEDPFFGDKTISKVHLTITVGANDPTDCSDIIDNSIPISPSVSVLDHNGRTTYLDGKLLNPSNGHVLLRTVDSTIKLGKNGASLSIVHVPFIITVDSNSFDLDTRGSLLDTASTLGIKLVMDTWLEGCTHVIIPSNNKLTPIHALCLISGATPVSYDWIRSLLNITKPVALDPCTNLVNSILSGWFPSSPSYPFKNFHHDLPSEFKLYHQLFSLHPSILHGSDALLPHHVRSLKCIVKKCGADIISNDQVGDKSVLWITSDNVGPLSQISYLSISSFLTCLVEDKSIQSVLSTNIKNPIDTSQLPLSSLLLSSLNSSNPIQQTQLFQSINSTSNRPITVKKQSNDIPASILFGNLNGVSSNISSILNNSKGVASEEFSQIPVTFTASNCTSMIHDQPPSIDKSLSQPRKLLPSIMELIGKTGMLHDIGLAIPAKPSSPSAEFNERGPEFPSTETINPEDVHMVSLSPRPEISVTSPDLLLPEPSDNISTTREFMQIQLISLVRSPTKVREVSQIAGNVKPFKKQWSDGPILETSEMKYPIAVLVHAQIESHGNEVLPPTQNSKLCFSTIDSSSDAEDQLVRDVDIPDQNTVIPLSNYHSNIGTQLLNKQKRRKLLSDDEDTPDTINKSATGRTSVSEAVGPVLQPRPQVRHRRRLLDSP